MNYRHAFHAGNFADVIKHAVLARILMHLRDKPQPFRVIDTHAGAGLYDLAGPEASRSGEWRAGVGRLHGLALAPAVHALLAPYLETIAKLNNDGPLRRYPGSPLLALSLMRPQDRLIACELEPQAAAALANNLRADKRAKAIAIDGFVAVNAYVPPKERRGLVLIDPPFEDVGDFPRLAQALEAAYRKWPSGTYLMWYPIKERTVPDTLARRLRKSAMAKILRAELAVTAPHDGGRLGACALVVVNPPWTLADELAVLLPELAAVLSAGGAGTHCVDWLAGEK